MPDPEVPERPVRRHFSAEYKLRIVEEANAATEPGEVGALLRREGLYSSHLVDWRQYRTGALANLARPRGRQSRCRRTAFHEHPALDFETQPHEQRRHGVEVRNRDADVVEANR